MCRWLCVAAVAVIVAMPALAENPHDGYAFWLPMGVFDPGNPDSVKQFALSTEGGTSSFTLHPRSTRMGVPRGQVVIVSASSAPSATYSVDGKPSGKLGQVTFIPLEATLGKSEVRVSVDAAAGALSGLRAYLTDDADKLGLPIVGDLGECVSSPDKHVAAYARGVLGLWAGDAAASRALREGAALAPSAASARLLRRLARWAEAQRRFAEVHSAEGFYDLGLYCMVGGYWDLAVSCFRRATELAPRNPDAWYMLGDALSYQLSDLDLGMAAMYPCYRRAADLYPREGSNTWRTFFGFFRKLRLADGTVLTMTDDQMDHARKMWEWCSAIMESASRGALRMENTYRILDQEVDNSRDWDPRPFAGLFQPGTVETFMKMTGWGASDACGHDVGPDRSAMVNMGIREWDVMLHEWNHTLDWSMISSELGVGVPATHSSDWCGFEPISSMGMGHHSCNRYYMTPGMYRYIRGSDPPATPFVLDWRVSVPAELFPAVAETTDAFRAEVTKRTMAVMPPSQAAISRPVRAHPNGWVDLGRAFAQAPPNAYAFARCYVYSPSRRKVRMWLGADDDVRVWLNGKLVHKGLYWAVCNFQEARERDQIPTGVMLEKGWNTLLLQITNAQHGEDWIVPGVRPDSWGFSVRICDTQNRAVPGLKWQAERPSGALASPPPPVNPHSPRTYRWADVADDYTALLPELSLDDLRAITGYRQLEADDSILFRLGDGAAARALGAPVLDHPDPSDVALNNQLNWFFSPKELAAVVRYRRGKATRDLLFLRPEGYEAFLKLMPVSSEARALGIKRQSDQVIGYFLVPREDCANGRIVLVVDTCLGRRLPIDEEDLLSIASVR